MVLVAADGGVDLPRFFWDDPLGQGLIFPVHRMILELGLQPQEGFLGFGDHEQTGGVFVDPVHDAGPGRVYAWGQLLLAL